MKPGQGGTQQDQEPERVEVRPLKRTRQNSSQGRLPPLHRIVHGGKRLTSMQHRELSEMYGDRYPDTLPVMATTNSCVKPRAQDELWEASLLKTQKDDDDEDARNEAALAEVIGQFDEEDREVSPDGSSDPDYDLESKRVTPKSHKKRHQKQAVNRALDTEDDDAMGDEDDDRPVVGQFLEGFPMYWNSWNDFYTAFDGFQAATFQRFPARSSTSIVTRNNAIAAAQKKARKIHYTKRAKNGNKKAGRRNQDVTGETMLPESWDKYSRTFVTGLHGFTPGVFHTWIHFV
ncbi:hypothetical protein DVH05_026457 [Phytophthora capsici]|nr:hypothetical protein DVH05_026457 [Phytophthora capsici]